jgi:hypothetical protein
MVKIEEMIEELKEYSRFHKVRGRKFSEKEMNKYNIRGIYNMTGELAYMSPNVVKNYCAGLVKPLSNEMCIIESSLKDTGKGNPLKIVSVMVFRDRFMYNLFAMAEGLDQNRYRDKDGYAEPILGLLN